MCITYVGILGLYLLVGLIVAVILLKETWRYVLKHAECKDLSPVTYHKVCFVANVLLWPLVVYLILKEWNCDWLERSKRD